MLALLCSLCYARSATLTRKLLSAMLALHATTYPLAAVVVAHTHIGGAGACTIMMVSCSMYHVSCIGLQAMKAARIPATHSSFTLNNLQDDACVVRVMFAQQFADTTSGVGGGRTIGGRVCATGSCVSCVSCVCILCAHSPRPRSRLHSPSLHSLLFSCSPARPLSRTPSSGTGPQHDELPRAS